jgi:hypothetical protein
MEKSFARKLNFALEIARDKDERVGREMQIARDGKTRPD